MASVPTLVKTVSSASAGAAGSVALPVTAGAININVSLAQQKALSAAQQGLVSAPPFICTFRCISMSHVFGNL